MGKYIQEYKNQLSVRSTREPVISLTPSAQNIFGSISRSGFPINTNMDFIPADGDSNIIDLNGGMVSPIWAGLHTKKMQFWAYVYCSPLASVIDRLAEAYANGVIELRDEDGSTVKKKSWMNSPAKKRVMKLLMQPNPIQTWQEFFSEQKVYAKIYGYCPMFSICPAGMDKTYSTYLWNLNPLFAKPVMEENIDLRKPKNPIKFWTLDLFGKNYGEIPSSEVLLIKDGFINATGNEGLPLSKIAGLDYAISNICAAMEADNVLLKKKGPLGVFSYDAKPDIAGVTPLPPGKKDELQKDLTRYGLSWDQLQYVVSKFPLKWNAMSFNLRDLMTKETARQGIDMICDRYSYPAELMSGKNATYENRNSAEKYMYQNTVIPFSLRVMSRYNQFFDLADADLFLDYQHLPVLQEDIVHAGQAYKANVEGLQVEWMSGMITFNQWQIAQNRDTVSGMDIYYPEWAKNNGIDLNPKPISNEKTDKSKD